MQKQTQLSEMPVAVLIITIIVMLGLLMGALYYFAANIAGFNPSIVVAPIKEGVIITTDKLEYEQGEKLKVTIKNNSNNSVWYFFEIYSNNLKLMGYKNKQWTVVPMLPSSPLPPGHIPEYLGLKPNESAILEYAPENEIDKKFLDYEKYKLSFSYEKNKYSKSQKILYSNEFTINKKTATTEDQCDIVEKVDSNTEIKGIIAESDSDYKDSKLKCIGTNGCSWQSLGGREEKYYACCPINFEDSSNEQVQLRCGIEID